MTEPKEKVTTADVNAALLKHYAPDRHVVMFDVGNGTGFDVSRRADVLVQSLWPSDGLHLIGLEVKVSRSDWQRELADAGKSLAFSRYCNGFGLVAPKGVCHPGELPEGWGLLLYTDGALRWSARPTFTQTPEPITPTLRAAMLRAAAKGPESMAVLRASIERAERERVKAQYEHQITDARNGRIEAERQLTTFRDACGAFSAYQIHGALQLLEKEGEDHLVSGLRQRAQALESKRARVNEVLALLEEAPV